MIVPIIGISTAIPSNYEELARRLRQLGLEPTGNITVDQSRLKQAINNRIEKFELKKQEEQNQKDKVQENLELEKPGATHQALLNRLFHNI